jgi:O-antigen/teichoic acid export membrane protein
VLIYEGKTRIVAIYSSVSSIVLCISIVISAIKYGNYEYLVIIKTIMPGVGFFFLAFILIKSFRNVNIEVIRFSGVSSILCISLPLAFASMAGAVSQQLDKIIVSSFMTPTDFAIYVNGAIEIPLIGVITGSISAVMLGEMSKCIKEQNVKQASCLFKETANRSALVLFPVLIFLLINGDLFVVALFSSKYVLSSVIFRIYLLLLPIRIVVFGSALIALGKGKKILIRSVVELFLNLILSYLLLKYFGYYGVAMATVIVVYVWSVPFNVMEISKGFKVGIFELFNYSRICKILLLSIIFSPIVVFFRYLNILDVIKLLCSSMLYFAILAYIFRRLKYV